MDIKRVNAGARGAQFINPHTYALVVLYIYRERDEDKAGVLCANTATPPVLHTSPPKTIVHVSTQSTQSTPQIAHNPLPLHIFTMQTYTPVSPDCVIATCIRGCNTHVACALSSLRSVISRMYAALCKLRVWDAVV